MSDEVKKEETKTEEKPAAFDLEALKKDKSFNDFVGAIVAKETKKAEDKAAKALEDQKKALDEQRKALAKAFGLEAEDDEPKSWQAKLETTVNGFTEQLKAEKAERERLQAKLALKELEGQFREQKVTGTALDDAVRLYQGAIAGLEEGAKAPTVEEFLKDRPYLISQEEQTRETRPKIPGQMGGGQTAKAGDLAAAYLDHKHKKEN